MGLFSSGVNWDLHARDMDARARQAHKLGDRTGEAYFKRDAASARRRAAKQAQRAAMLKKAARKAKR